MGSSNEADAGDTRLNWRTCGDRRGRLEVALWSARVAAGKCWHLPTGDGDGENWEKNLKLTPSAPVVVMVWKVEVEVDQVVAGERCWRWREWWCGVVAPQSVGRGTSLKLQHGTGQRGLDSRIVTE